MRPLAAALFFVLAALSAAPAYAHHQHIVELALREVEAGRFQATWSGTDVLRDPRAAALVLRPVFPAHCKVELPLVDCAPGGLDGRLAFRGLGNVPVDVLVRIAWLDAPASSLMFTKASPQVELAAGGGEALGMVASSFTWLGIEHIWRGPDHLLFVLGLVWLVGSMGMLLKTITAFTAAHSVTLALSALGGVSLPIAPVEAAIALSVALVAVEVIHERQGRLDLGARAPWVLALAFGLLHGFGFAGALEELALVRDQRAAALLFFNVGVELGQLVFVAAILGAQRLSERYLPRRPRWVSALPPYAMGSVAMFWCITRIAGL